MSELTFCQQCHKRCRVYADVVNGKIESLKKAHCIKGTTAHEFVYHPDRLTYPKKRVGKRGEGKWERISWDEALTIMSSKFKQIIESSGAEAIATVTSDYHKVNSTTASNLFAYLIGTPTVLDANILCSLNAIYGEVVTYGELMQWESQMDLPRSKCVILWGSSRTATGPPHAKDILSAKANGAKLIVVDPRPIPLASKADLWLRVRPGTDGALALAMIYTIVKEGLYDKDFVDKWCNGFEELKERVQQYTPAKAAEITQIPEEKIIEAARLLATNKPVCSNMRLGIGSQYVGATHACQAVAGLTAIIGCIDVEGGNLLNHDLGGFKKCIFNSGDYMRLTEDVEKKRIGAKEFPMSCGTASTAPFWTKAHTPMCIDTMLAGDIKAFFVMGSNIIAMAGNSRKVWEALKKLEFSVVVDHFMVPAAEIADVVLPAAHWLECDTPTHPCQIFGPNLFNYVLAAAKVIEPVGECWDDRKIVLELAKKMHLKSGPWGENVEQLNDWRLEGTGVSFEELKNKPRKEITFPISYKQYEERGFATPSGKVELCSKLFEDQGYDPLPSFTEPPESPINTPDLVKEYPLLLITFRQLAHVHSEGRQASLRLRKIIPDPLLEINPKTAEKLGIKEGDDVWVERPKFEEQVKGKAKFVPQLHPDVVGFPVGWWFPEKPGPEHGCFESNINTIISDGPPYDTVFGNYQARGLLCKVGKV